MAEHKRRARWRLLGAVIIAGSVAALAPVLLEEQARPLSQDLLIEIPSKESVFAKIESLKSSPESVPVEQKPAAETKSGVETKSSVESKPADTKAAVEQKPAAEPAAPSSVPATKPATAPASSTADPAAILAGKVAPKAEPKPEPKPATTPDGRFLVQVGAYAKIEAANAVKTKLTAGGHTVAIETIKTAEGVERHRVRIGPFATKELATQVRDRAKAQGYDAAVIGP